MTPEQVKAFQKGRLNHLGAFLNDDGDLGPQTRWALDIATLCPRRQLIVRRMSAAVGVGVDELAGDNRHPIIDLVLRRCLTQDGESWCAALASDAIGDVAIAGAMALLRHYPPTTNPMPGDLYGYPTGPWQGHVGVFGAGTLSEIMGWEGNSRNKARTVRRARAGLLFAKVCADVSGRCPVIPPKVPWEETRATTEGTR